MASFPDTPNSTIAELSRRHLEDVVAIDSCSDETSTTVPSTPGQRELSLHLERFFAGLGARVEVDEYANLIATVEGRGAAAGKPALALMIHLDTARGTEAVEKLDDVPGWDGSKIPYAQNDRLYVSVEHYPATRPFVGQQLLFGSGRAPFGLDDKLGLAHLMTLVQLLADNPDIEHRPLFIVARPDEEIGRMEALVGLAELLRERGVDSAYTIDGIAPFEINVESFNGMGAQVRFPRRVSSEVDGEVVRVELFGVNTHGATAKAEGHRSALRFAAQLHQRLSAQPFTFLGFESDAVRDCDGVLHVAVGEGASVEGLDAALQEMIAPHVPRGAGYRVTAGGPRQRDAAIEAVLRFVSGYMATSPGFTLWAEDSDERDGYSQPFRVRVSEDSLCLDIRIRDFAVEGLAARRQHLAQFAADQAIEFSHHYDNMGTRMAARPDLVETALAAADEVGVSAPIRPIRGGTGVDPFLERGIYVANLGTGYFAPESEKEFTSLELMAQHARWLVALVQK
ncbi:MAG: peptidase T [Myxococcales bacterium FL481]|nr:MAG: peptidase T [Myxococcales bacterium FL481]